MHLKQACCAALAAAALTTMTPMAGALSGVSDWARIEVSKAEMEGLAPDSFLALDATGNITRAEFCAVALRLFESSTGRKAALTGISPFTDTHDPHVIAASALGLVSGRGNGTFDPNAPVTRQEMCVMLGNVRRAVAGGQATGAYGLITRFGDSREVASWAANDMAQMVEYGVISGIAQPDGTVALSPGTTATREQSLMMAVRFRAVCASAFDPEGYRPANEIPPAPEPEPEPAPEPEPPALSDDPETPPADELEREEPAPEEPVQPIRPDAAYDLSDSEKEALVFGENGRGYDTPEQAEAAMTDITVPVWRLQKDGTKTAGKMSLKVNAALADLYTAVFEEIFAGEEQFPIKDGGSYAWRSNARSEHRWGTAVDLNWDENMECRIDEAGNVTQITTGTCWEPGSNPYSIPADGDVVRAFKKYGFAWGGDAWSGKRDYMHFSYFGR